MPLLYWALETIEQTLIPGGYRIVTTSDIAVHMWLRWTYRLPQKHLKSVISRGLVVMQDARFCFVDFCDVEQTEAGDTYTHTFFIPSTEPPPIPPTSDWPFYEPWGTFLTENYPWVEHGFLYGSNTSLAAGKMTLYNDAQLGINISTPTLPAKPPLGSGTGIDLYLSYSSPAVDHDPTYGWLTYILVTKNDSLPGDVFDIEPIVARGSAWGPWGDHEAVFDSVYAFDMGQGPAVINFTETWIHGRQLAGKTSNPTGWYIDEIFITNEQTLNPVPQSHTNDYLGFYLSQSLPCNMKPWLPCETRYFYFWATNMGEPMKSTSPTFSKHYAPPTLPLIFYSDQHPEVSSVDGGVANLTLARTFAQSRAGPGTAAWPSLTVYMCRMRVSGDAPPNNWYEFARFICLWDMTAALGATISTAKVHLYGLSKFDNEGKNPAIGMYLSNPASDTDLIPVDFGTLGVAIMSNTIPYTDFAIAAWNVLTINTAGIAIINGVLAGAGILRMGIREVLYDVANIDPFPGKKNRLINFMWEDVDHPSGHKPYLEVTYV